MLTICVYTRKTGLYPHQYKEPIDGVSTYTKIAVVSMYGATLIENFHAYKWFYVILRSGVHSA